MEPWPARKGSRGGDAADSKRGRTASRWPVLASICSLQRLFGQACEFPQTHGRWQFSPTASTDSLALVALNDPGPCNPRVSNLRRGYKAEAGGEPSDRRPAHISNGHQPDATFGRCRIGAGRKPCSRGCRSRANRSSFELKMAFRRSNALLNP